MRVCCNWLISFLGFSLSVVVVNGQTYSFTYSSNPPSNPWIRHSPGSDPAANVWGDTVWVYCSQDANLRLEGLGPDVYKYDYMDGYRALSSTDMINWVDHGEVFHSRNVAWAMRGWMWAPSAHWNGKTGSDAKYYLYYPCKDSAGGVWRIGVAMAPTPAGPFTDIGAPIAGLSGIDPHVFKDDDNQVYLYYNRHEVVKLKDNFIEIAEPVRTIDYGQTNLEYKFQFEEGSFMHKYNGKYYYSYSHWHPTEPTMGYYAIGTSPYGPFEWKGGLTGRKSGSQDHHSIIQFKGEWYYFTHMDTPWKERFVDLNWYGQRRISCYQKLYYNDDGTIRQVNPNAWALNTGEDGPFISVEGGGVEYYWDQWYSYADSNIRTVDTSVSIANTLDDQIYRSFRFGTSFTYEIPVENNVEYLVTFKFAELSHDTAGKRKFNVVVEGETKITDLDVFIKAGNAKNTAYDETHSIIVRDHVMNIQFISSIDNAMIAGIYIRPKMPTVPVPTVPSPVTAPVPPVSTPIAPMAPASVPVAPVLMPMMAPVPSPVNAIAPTAPAPVPVAPVPVPVPMPSAPVPSPVNAPVPTAPVPAPTAPIAVPVAPVPAPVPMPLAPVPSPASAPVPTAPVPVPTAPIAVPVAPVPAPAAPIAVPVAPVTAPTAPIVVPMAPVPAPVPMPMAPVPMPSATQPVAPVPTPSAPVPAPVPLTPTAPISAPSVPVPAPVSIPMAPVSMPSAPAPIPTAPGPTPSAPVPKAPVPTQSDSSPIAAPSGALPTVPPVPIAPPVPAPTGPIPPIPKEPTIPPRVPAAPTLPPSRKPKLPKIQSFLKWLLGLVN